MKLTALMRFNVAVAAPIEVGPTPTGLRMVANITGGAFDGERLTGRIHASGADWILVDQTGMGRVDVRIVLETHDGANIYVTYGGLLELNERFGQATASGGETRIGELYLMTHLRFETGDPRYQWLNQLLAVGEGRVVPGGIEYQVYELQHG
ncbi:DUF3237 domain-containing protein [Immundisolibacter sp.]|uniref:DUF3237 domain-containing protein n=1 Tax=Immundisolibacter sp. TaxID=1934948 RepID=UPI003566F985